MKLYINIYICFLGVDKLRNKFDDKNDAIKLLEREYQHYRQIVSELEFCEFKRGNASLCWQSVPYLIQVIQEEKEP